MTTLYGGKHKQHHIRCNYSNGRIGKPCSQCDRLYRLGELSAAETAAHDAANAIRLMRPDVELKYKWVREFLTFYGYEEKRIKVLHGNEGEATEVTLFTNPHCFYCAVLPVMAENDVLPPVHVQRFLDVLRNNDPLSN